MLSPCQNVISSKAVHRKKPKTKQCAYLEGTEATKLHVVGMPFTPNYCDCCNLGYLLSCV